VSAIPNCVDQPASLDFDRDVYRRQKLVERLVEKLKQFRGLPTRYDKLDAHYLAFLQFAPGHGLATQLWQYGLARWLYDADSVVGAARDRVHERMMDTIDGVGSIASE
jgi:hypothetical protein